MTQTTKAEKELHAFVSKTLNKELPTNFYESLKDGVTLIEFYNTLFPNKTLQINKPIHPFKMRENLLMFLEECRVLGVPEPDLFVTEDFFESRYRNVEICLLVFLIKVNEIKEFKGKIPSELLVDPSIPENPVIPVIRASTEPTEKKEVKKIDKPPTSKYAHYCFGEVGSTFRPPKLDIHADLPRQIKGNFAEDSGPTKIAAKTEKISFEGLYEAGQTFKPPKVDIHADLPRQIKGNFAEDSGPTKIAAKTEKISFEGLYEAGQTFKPPKVDIHADLPRQIKGNFAEDSGPNKKENTEQKENNK